MSREAAFGVGWKRTIVVALLAVALGGTIGLAQYTVENGQEITVGPGGDFPSLTGPVTVESGGTLILEGGTINGAVLAGDQSTVNVFSGVITGDFLGVGISVATEANVTLYGASFEVDDAPYTETTIAYVQGGVNTHEVVAYDAQPIELYDIVVALSPNASVTLGEGGETPTAPEIDSVVADTSDPVVEGSTVTVTVTFAGSLSDATITWGDGSADTTLDDVEAPSFDATHVYCAAGVYTVGVTLTNDGGTDSASYEYVVVYDPTSGALVTGLGWIPDESVAFGRTYFGFLCTQWGGGTPCGWVRVRWGDKRFCATELDWVGADDLGETAWFGGVGRVNGAGEYFFIVELTDNPDSIWITIFYDEEYDSGGFVGLGDGVTRIRMYDWN